jgi:hypothetical protein
MTVDDLLHEEPGWLGAFTRQSAPGALPAGSPVLKANSEPGDGHPNGTPGVVLGSLPAAPGKILYFVEWQPRPHVAVATADFKLQPAP